MIASFSRRFIFLKTRKVGGTSMEIVLSSWCAGRDICTPISSEDEALREAQGGRARNWLRGDIEFFNHMPAAAVRAALPKLWREGFKFSVERHPYEKVVSRAWWEVGRRGGRDDEIGVEIDRAIRQRSYLNHPIYMIDGKLAVDELWRFDKAWDRLAALGARLGAPVPSARPRAKASYRRDRRSAREILTPDQRRQIQRDAQIEFELMNFRP